MESSSEVRAAGIDHGISLVSGSGAAFAPSIRAAVIDRDRGFLVVLDKRLGAVGIEHEVIAPRAAMKALAERDVDVLIVDLGLISKPWPWLERVRALRPQMRIIVCTAESSVAERVRALELGVDDWLAKPCHPEELVARVEAVTLRRGSAGPALREPVRLGEVIVRPDQYQAFVRGSSLELTRREYQLILLLLRAPGEVLAREHIYKQLWGYEMVRNDRSVDVFVHKLRRKLAVRSPDWLYIHTKFRVGYSLAPQLKGALPAGPLAPAPVAAQPAVERLPLAA
jgi:DNA-binding response OmpR family regulator